MNRIGEVLCLDMAKSHLVLVDNQIRFLSKFFTKKDEELVHGANIFSAYLSEQTEEFVQDIEKANLSRELLTFQFTLDAIKFVFPDEYDSISRFFVKMLVFDAITGNNDRHFYNWGVLRDIRGIRKARFSPVYDSARGLFWNTAESKIEQYIDGKTIINQKEFDRYLNKYLNNSLPKVGWDGSDKVNHFQLIEKLFNEYPNYQTTCKVLLEDVLLQDIINMLKREFNNFFSSKRLILIEQCLIRRFITLQKICK